MKKQFKYSATFDVLASVKKQSMKNFTAKASIDELEDLRTLLPSNEEMKMHDDLLFCSFNLAVAGLINANNHGILPETALQLLPYWQHRPLNIEHNRRCNVGVITNAGFSSFPDNKIMTTEQVSAATSPFNIAIAGVVWKIADPYFADFLECTNDEEDEWCYKKMATSWEVGFSDYIIARGSKNLFTAEIIRDADEIARLTPFLTQFGGTGFDNTNTEVYLVISGEARALAGGFTENPAAAVSGVYVPDLEEEEEDEEEEDEVEEPEMKPDPELEMDDKKKSTCSEISANNISQKPKLTVKKINSMKFKDINDFCDKYSEATAKQEVFATSDIREFFEKSLVKEVENWQSEVSKHETKVLEAEARVDELQSTINAEKEKSKEQADALAALKSELDALKEKVETEKVESVLASRISDLASKYTLNEKALKLISDSIKGKSDEELTAWLADQGEVILAGKEKVAETPEEGLKEVKASKDFIPNAGSESQKQTEDKSEPSVTRKGQIFSISL